MPVWPGGLPSKPLMNTLVFRREDILDRFRPDAGGDIIRRTASNAGAALSFAISLTDAQFTTLMAFYEDTLEDGEDSFTWVHPYTGVVETYRFTAPPQVTNRALGAHVAQITLYQEP